MGKESSLSWNLKLSCEAGGKLKESNFVLRHCFLVIQQRVIF